MYEVFFYAGIVFAIGAFIISIFLFFSLKIPEVIRYYVDSVVHKNKNVNMRVHQKNSSRGSFVPKKRPGAKAQTADSEATELLNYDDQADVMDIARNYATAMLNADEGTEILSD